VLRVAGAIVPPIVGVAVLGDAVRSGWLPEAAIAVLATVAAAGETRPQASCRVLTAGG
jgi:hypothetical protein